MRVGVLHNPLSGRNKRHPDVISEAFKAKEPPLFSDVTTPGEIQNALVEFSQANVTTLFINGGDGTIQATIDALFNLQPFPSFPQLALLPAGTANMIAGDVGLGAFTSHTVREFFEKSQSPTPQFSTVQRAVLRIRFHPYREPLHGMFFGAGALCQGTQTGRQTKQTIGRLGEWGAGLIFLKYLWAVATGSQKNLSPVSIGISTSEGHVKHEDYVLVLATTLQRLIVGLMPFWGQAPYPVRFTSVRIPFRCFWRVLPSVIRGKAHPLANRQNGYISQNFQSIRLHMKEGFVLDGEVYPPSPHEVGIQLDSCGALTFLRLSS